MVSTCQVLAVTALSIAAAGTATTDAKFVPQLIMCNKFAKINWDDVKYTCAWEHTVNGGTYSNIFIKRYNGNLDFECSCDDGLSTYNPWGSRWTWSKNGAVTCYTRDGKQASEIASQFDSVNCASPSLVWVPDRR